MRDVRPLHGPVGAHHLLVGDEGLVILIKGHELLEYVLLVLEVLLDGPEDRLGVGLLADHVTLLLVLLHQSLDGSREGRALCWCRGSC